MVLSQTDMRRLVQANEVSFDPPLEESQWSQASVDLRLGFSFTKLKGPKGTKIIAADGVEAILDGGFWETTELDVHGNNARRRTTYEVGPGDFILSVTHESVKIPRNMIGLVEGRSTYARLGLSMHQTAHWVQPGSVGKIVLEIVNNGPLTVQLTPVLDRPCQLTLFRLSSELPEHLAYGGRKTDQYANQTHPYLVKRRRT